MAFLACVWAHPGRLLPLAFLGMILSGPARAACGLADPADAFPVAAQAVNTWSQNHELAVATSAKQGILADFCAVAEALEAEKGISTAAVDERAGPSVTEYLDRIADPTKVSRSLEAIVRSQFGAAGFSRPTQKLWGVVRVTYQHTADALQIGNDYFEPWPSLLVEVGRTVLVGLNQQAEVCRVDLQVSAVAETQVTC